MQRQTRNNKLVAASTAALIAALWCGSVAAETRPPNPIQIGAVLPLTGSAAVWGQNAKRGMELALQEINANGGINGRKLAVLYEDSQSDPKAATSALEKLIASAHVPTVIGDIASSSVLAMAPIAERNQVVLLSPGASNPDISDAGSFIFRNWQSDALEGEIDARHAFSVLGWRRVACLYVNNAYGAGLNKVFTEKFRAMGGEIAAEESFLQGATDLRAQIGRVGAAKPDGVYMPGYPPEMAVALKQMKETGVHLPLLSVQAFDDPEILERAGQAADGVLFSVPKIPDPTNPVVAHFRSTYTSAYGQQPGVCSDTGYDALRIVAWALGQGATTGPEIRDKLNRLRDFPGAAGSTTFDSRGDVIREFDFKIIRAGKAVLLSEIRQSAPSGAAPARADRTETEAQETPTPGVGRSRPETDSRSSTDSTAEASSSGTGSLAHWTRSAAGLVSELPTKLVEHMSLGYLAGIVVVLGAAIRRGLLRWSYRSRERRMLRSLARKCRKSRREMLISTLEDYVNVLDQLRNFTVTEHARRDPASQIKVHIYTMQLPSEWPLWSIDHDEIEPGRNALEQYSFDFHKFLTDGNSTAQVRRIVVIDNIMTPAGKKRMLALRRDVNSDYFDSYVNMLHGDATGARYLARRRPWPAQLSDAVFYGLTEANGRRSWLFGVTTSFNFSEDLILLRIHVLGGHRRPTWLSATGFKSLEALAEYAGSDSLPKMSDLKRDAGAGRKAQGRG